jgi:hypothetical protein
MQEGGSLKTLRANFTFLTFLLMVGTTQAAFSDSSASADTVESASAQSAADQLIAHVVSKLKDSSSVYAQFDEIDSHPGEYKDLKQSGSVWLDRPNKLDIEIQRFRRVNAATPWEPSGNNAKSVSDGKTYIYAFIHPHSTQVEQFDSNPAKLRSALKGLPSLAAFFRSNDIATLPDQAGSATLVGPTNWEGKSYQVIQYPLLSNQSGDIECDSLCWR